MDTALVEIEAEQETCYESELNRKDIHNKVFEHVFGPGKKNGLIGMGFGAKKSEQCNIVGRNRREVINAMRKNAEEVERGKREVEMQKREVELQKREMEVERIALRNKEKEVEAQKIFLRNKELEMELERERQRRRLSMDNRNEGSLDDFSSLLGAIKLVDTVICAVPSKQVLDQKPLIQAIKEAGCIKRFIPSEFGADPDKVQIRNMDYKFYEKKAEIRHLIEKEGIPYTYICCNFFMRYLLPSLVQPGLKTPPRDTIKIFGDGNTKAVFVKESDVAAFTITTIDVPQTLNKVLYLRPPGDTVSMIELANMWEMKIQKKLEKVYVSEEQLLESIQETSSPSNMDLIFIYSAFIKGDHTYFINESPGLEGTQLYPHVKYTTVSEYLDALL